MMSTVWLLQHSVPKDTGEQQEFLGYQVRLIILKTCVKWVNIVLQGALVPHLVTQVVTVKALNLALHLENVSRAIIAQEGLRDQI